jgi:hypothetical protein
VCGAYLWWIGGRCAPPRRARARLVKEGEGVTNDYDVRLATPSDRGAILAIVGEMWGCDVTARHGWLYLRNPHGKALTWVAQETAGDRAIVGVTSVFPRRVRVGDEELLGSLGGDCYVVPRARRKGLATRLHKATFSSMRPLGHVDFMAGPPRPNNLAALVKAGSHQTTVFRRWTRPLGADAVAGMLARRAAVSCAVPRSMLRPLGAGCDLAMRLLDEVRRDTRTQLEPLSSVPIDARELLEGIARTHDGRLVPVHDPDWMTWRYFSGPVRTQRVYALRVHGERQGFVVLETHGTRGVLVDLVVPAIDAVLDAALDAAVLEARSLGCEILDANFTLGTPVVPRLRSRGFFGRETHGFQVALAEGTDPSHRAHLLADSWTFSDGDKDRDTSFPAERH